jgi:hypothetical protein
MDMNRPNVEKISAALNDVDFVDARRLPVIVMYLWLHPHPRQIFVYVLIRRKSVQLAYSREPQDYLS